MQDDAMPLSSSDQASGKKRSRDSLTPENSANSGGSNNQLFLIAEESYEAEKELEMKLNSYQKYTERPESIDYHSSELSSLAMMRINKNIANDTSSSYNTEKEDEITDLKNAEVDNSHDSIIEFKRYSNYTGSNNFNSSHGFTSSGHNTNNNKSKATIESKDSN